MEYKCFVGLNLYKLERAVKGCKLFDKRVIDRRYEFKWKENFIGFIYFIGFE